VALFVRLFVCLFVYLTAHWHYLVISAKNSWKRQMRYVENDLKQVSCYKNDLELTSKSICSENRK